VAGRLELERVAVIREVGLAEPARGRGAVSLGQQARSRWDAAGQELDPDGNDSTKKLQEVEGDAFPAANTAVQG
jgi:hypothetical protein